MPTNEAIEVHVEFLRMRQDELKKDMRELRAEDGSIRERIDDVLRMLGQRIDAVEAKISK